jgi:hypothetical protein
VSFNTKAVLLTSAFIVSGAMLSPASAQGNADAARSAWAERHIQTVCAPLKARGLKVRAARCYRNVARAKADPNVDFRDVTASLPPARSAEVATPASNRMNRCVGIACIQRFPTLGISY